MGELQEREVIVQKGKRGLFDRQEGHGDETHSTGSAAPLHTLSVEGLHKSFGHVQAVNGVSFQISPGEIHGLIGHNGSGKSTVVKIIGGVYEPDAGRIVLGRSASGEGGTQRAGNGAVATLHQDLGLVPSMSVVDNFLISRTAVESASCGRRREVLHWKADRRFVQERLAEVGLTVDVRRCVSELSLSERVLLALARVQVELLGRMKISPDGAAVGAEAALIVLDEPTSRLPSRDVERLFDGIKRLVARLGVGVLLVTHHISDVTDVCDSFTALKNGRSIGTYSTSNIAREDIAEMMAGGLGGRAEPTSSAMAGAFSEPRSAHRPARIQPPTTDAEMPPQEEVLSVRHLSGSQVEDVSLAVRRGEVLGVTGLPGSGYEELPYLISGAKRRAAGVVELRGERIGPDGLLSFRSRGGLLIPSDRSHTSGVPGATVRENLMLGDETTVRSRGFLRRRRELAECRKILQRMAVPVRDIDRPLSVLSGGQQQKVIIGRCFRAAHSVLLLDDPAIAVDVGARGVIIEGIRELACKGTAIVYSSGQSEELAIACDRVAVFARGRIAGWLERSEISEENILMLAYG